jgi:hypothetical protein
MLCIGREIRYKDNLLGFFIGRSQSRIWRGPMAANAVKQLFEDTQWGEIDYMIVTFLPEPVISSLPPCRNLTLRVQ